MLGWLKDLLNGIGSVRAVFDLREAMKRALPIVGLDATCGDGSNASPEHVNLRRTRSGATFSSFYTVNNPDFDLDALLEKRCDEEQDEADLTGADAVADPPSGTPSPLSSLPPSPSSSRSPSPRPKEAKRPRLDTPATPPSAPPPPATSSINPDVHKASKKKRSRGDRQKKAQMRAAGRDWTAPTPGALRNSRHLVSASFVGVDLDWQAQPVTRTGFTALRDDGEEDVYALEDFFGPNPVYYGFKLVEWDGRETCGICSQDERVFGVCAGHPDDPDWHKVHKALADAICKCGESVKFPKDAREHRRGKFGAQACGVSHGGGQTAPANLKHTPKMAAMLTYLINLTAMIRVAHFASSVFFNWAPRLWLFYAKHMQTIFEHDPTLERNFAQSVWACITINFGPRTMTYKHRDFGNLPFGWCAITALGKFDPNRGGHLILWECGLVIRFPPGSTIIIPSGIIHHSNIKIAEDETRYSVTQYTSGALFRWAQHGCKLDEDFYSSLTPSEYAREKERNKNRWREGARLWSTISELRSGATERVDTLDRPVA
ncbi:uncharacterized protein SCHCODRAFT_02672872 [Schizophyllum commune H4-8]|uniref:Uncharacterized protein n=1 Tax=Schizophyllum commune (strain H4-8 / FGSC 9210) TaxID=578458 RepID=D8QJ10_SCHCM|nr:uncharacterized protein SCHCODRAFT_02672872 [Schizophyllum commune H4-8]KAI5885768.1 hypothetical protein SCHCODRAFT_02672872 [Schizophyllum commune H4-8]